MLYLRIEGETGLFGNMNLEFVRSSVLEKLNQCQYGDIPKINE